MHAPLIPYHGQFYTMVPSAWKIGSIIIPSGILMNGRFEKLVLFAIRLNAFNQVNQDTIELETLTKKIRGLHYGRPAFDILQLQHNRLIIHLYAAV